MSSLNLTVLPGQTQIALGSDLLARDAAKVKGQLHEALGRGLPVRISSERLERVDTAGLQLLLAFVLQVKAKGLGLEWDDGNETLSRAFARLGLARAAGFA